VRPQDAELEGDEAEARGAMPAPREGGPLPGRGSDAAALPAQVQYCEYCGAQVNPRVYFCLRCATPYKSIEAVLTPAEPLKMTDGLRVERMVPQVKPLFWTYFSVVVAAGVVSYVLFAAAERPGVAVLLSSGAVFVTTVVFAFLHWPSLGAQLRRVGFLNGHAWLALALLAPLVGLNYGYHRLLLSLGVEPALPIEKLREMMGTRSLVLLVCILPAVSEEIAFRGLLQHWLQVAIRPARAVAVAAGLFVVLHFTVLSAPYLFLVGLLLGYAKWKTGSLYPSILIHFLHNFIVVMFFRF